MKTTKVITVKPHVYDGIKRKVGDRYEADAKYLSLLVAMGVVRIAEEDEPGRYRRRDMRAQK